MATFGIMPAFGMNLDAITILALVIALGMLVDNAVVVLESIFRCRDEDPDPRTAALRGVHEVGGARVAGDLHARGFGQVAGHTKLEALSYKPGLIESGAKS